VKSRRGSPRFYRHGTEVKLTLCWIYVAAWRQLIIIDFLFIALDSFTRMIYHTRKMSRKLDFSVAFYTHKHETALTAALLGTLNDLRQSESVTNFDSINSRKIHFIPHTARSLAPFHPPSSSSPSFVYPT
jgi:hypothetical protein